MPAPVFAELARHQTSLLVAMTYVAADKVMLCLFSHGEGCCQNCALHGVRTAHCMHGLDLEWTVAEHVALVEQSSGASALQKPAQDPKMP